MATLSRGNNELRELGRRIANVNSDKVRMIPKVIFIYFFKSTEVNNKIFALCSCIITVQAKKIKKIK